MLERITSLLPSFLIFGLLILLHEFGHFLAARAAGVAVQEFSIGFGPALWRTKKRGTEFSLRIFPFGGYVLMDGEEYEDDDEVAPDSLRAQTPLTRISIFAAGALANLLLGYVVLVLLTGINGYVGTTTISSLWEDSPVAGILQPGDQIVSINGRSVYSANDVFNEFLTDEDGLLSLRIVREGEELLLRRVQFPLRTVEGVGMVQMGFRMLGRKTVWSDYLWYPLNWGLSILRQVWYSLSSLLSGRFGLNQLTGPIGTSAIIGEAASIGSDAVLLITAMLSINLGAFNLIPFPILDGGKIVIVLFEALSGIRLSERVEYGVNLAGLCLLGAVMLFVTYNDILRVFLR